MICTLSILSVEIYRNSIRGSGIIFVNTIWNQIDFISVIHIKIPLNPGNVNFIVSNLLRIWISITYQKMNKWIWNPFHNIQHICSNISLRLVIHLQVLATEKTALSPLCTYITAKNYMIIRQRNKCKILNHVTVKHFISNTFSTTEI